MLVVVVLVGLFWRDSIVHLQETAKWYYEDYETQIFEIKINFHFMFPVPGQILWVCSCPNNNKLKKSCMNVKHLNNCSQAIFDDGEIGRMRRWKRVGGDDIWGTEIRQNCRCSEEYKTDSSVQGLNFLLNHKEIM